LNKVLNADNQKLPHWLLSCIEKSLFNLSMTASFLQVFICLLAMRAGSMMISHANNAYFWVIIKFSSLEMKGTLKVYSVATILMGFITLLYILSLILLK